MKYTEIKDIQVDTTYYGRWSRRPVTVHAQYTSEGEVYVAYSERGVQHTETVENFKLSFFNGHDHGLRRGDVFFFDSSASATFLYLSEGYVIRFGSGGKFGGRTSGGDLDMYVQEFGNGDYTSIRRSVSFDSGIENYYQSE